MTETGIVERLRGNGRTPEDSAMIVSTTRAQDCWPTKIDVEAAYLIERQQKAIDLLLRAIEPFAETMSGFTESETADDDIDMMLLGSGLTSAHLRSARAAKEEAELILAASVDNREG